MGTLLKFSCLLLLLSALTGCFSSNALKITHAEVGFNDKLTPSLGATASFEAPRFYSNGQGGKPLVTPITFSAVDAAQMARLRLSRAFWVEREGFALLSYEVVFHNVSAEFYPDADEPEHQDYHVNAVGTCIGDNGLAVRPDTRGALEVTPQPDGTWVTGRFVIPGTVALQTCRGGAALQNPANPPAALDADCTEQNLRNLTSTRRADPLPFCVIEGDTETVTSDVSLALVPRTPDMKPLPPEFTARPMALPHIKVVADSRRLARRMTYRNAVDTQEGGRRHRFEFQVGWEDGLWTENFSPNLLVAKAYVFLEGAANSTRTYLSPAPLAAMTRLNPDDPDLVQKIGDCAPGDVLAEAAGPDDARPYLDIPECIERVTPAYVYANLSGGADIDDAQQIVWEYSLVTAPGEEPPFDPERAKLFIEFEVTHDSFGRSGSGLRAAAPASTLGVVPVGRPTAFGGAVRLLNDGAASLRVTQLTLSGPQAGEFSARPDAGSLPALIPGRGALNLTVEVTPALQGQRAASLAIQGNTPGGAAQTIRVGLIADARTGTLVSHPDTLLFHRTPDVPGDQEVASRPFLIENPGNAPLTRTAFVVSGAGQPHFSVVRADYGPTTHSPARASQVLNPGESEIVYVQYHPRAAGQHRAAVAIESTAGTAVVNLQGFCGGVCNDPPLIYVDNVPGVRIAINEAARGAKSPDMKTALGRLTPSAAIALFNVGAGDAAVVLLTNDNHKLLTKLKLIEPDPAQACPCPAPRYRVTKKGQAVQQALTKTGLLKK